MRKEKQIEEMASDIEQSGMLDSLSRCRIVAEELYLKGYRKKSDGVWIRVEERLPYKNGVFIVALEDGNYENLLYFDVRSYADGRWLNIPDKLKVTHWMHLPEPQKENDMTDKSTPKHPAYNCQRGMLCPTCDKALWVRVEIKGLIGKKKITVKEQPNFCKYCGQALLPAYTEN